MGLGVRILLERSEGEMPTTTDYVSSVSLLPTVEFLETIPKRQWSTENDYYVSFSPIDPIFHFSENDEVICLGSESDFLESSYGDAKIKNPFAYTRPESSPVLSVYQTVRILNPKQKPKSSFLYRKKTDGSKEVILVSDSIPSPSKSSDTNAIEAPLSDSFARECLSWFDSSADYFIGFGSISGDVGTIADGDSIAIISKSEDILAGAIDFSTASIPYTNIQVVNTVSALTPFVKIEMCTGVEYTQSGTSPNPSFLFLYTVNSSSESVVSFLHDFKEQVTKDMLYGEVTTSISWSPQDIVII
jgi:hypothetical protein